MTPSACRWLYAHAGGLIEVRVTAPTDSARARAGRSRSSTGRRRASSLSNHVALNGDDGAEAVPVRFARDANGIVVRPIPDTDVGRRFPDGLFRLDPQAGHRSSSKSAATRCCSPTGGHVSSRFVTVATAPAARVGFRITGGLVAGARDRAGRR